MTPHTVFVYKLSVSFDRNIEQANTRKRIRYANMETDIEDAGFICKNIPFEVGSRDQTEQTLQPYTKLTNPKPT